MNKDKLESMLGLCRKAGKLGMGHDVVITHVRKGRCQTVLLTEDASPRHRQELTQTNADITIRLLPFDSSELAPFVAKKCCIFSINDAGFNKAVTKILDEEEPPYGIEVQNS